MTARFLRGLRIVLVVPRLQVGGAETQLAQQARELMDAGHRVRVVALCEGGPIEERLAALGVETHILSYRGINLRAPHRMVASLRPLWAMLREADVVESHLSYATVPGMWVGALARAGSAFDSTCSL